MKVCHVLRRFVEESYGGVERTVFEVSKALLRRGVESVIFTTSMLAKPGAWVVEKVPLRKFSYCFPWFFLSREDKNKMEAKGGSPLSLSLFLALLKEKNVSLIHTHTQLRLGGIARSVARLKKVPYVVSIHGGYFNLSAQVSDKMRLPFKAKWEWGKVFGFLLGSRKVIQDADAIFCADSSEVVPFQQMYPKKKVYYVPNGVEIERFASEDPTLFRKRYSIPQDDRLLLSVSRIDPQKNQLLLVQAFGEISKRYPELKLVLIGSVSDPAYALEITEEIKRKKIEKRVLVIPGLSGDDPCLPSAYKAAELFILPSREEPFGLVILEAWAAGLPVLASCVGGVQVFTKDGVNVLHFESQNEKQLCEKISFLMEDAGKRKQLQEAGWEEVQNYSWDKIADLHIKYYAEILNKHKETS